jgi:hypothetical protein
MSLAYPTLRTSTFYYILDDTPALNAIGTNKQKLMPLFFSLPLFAYIRGVQ